MGAAGKMLQCSFARAAAVPAAGSTIGADDDGAASELDAGGETGDTATDEAGADGDSTPEESAALGPWVDRG